MGLKAFFLLVKIFKVLKMLLCLTSIYLVVFELYTNIIILLIENLFNPLITSALNSTPPSTNA